MGEIEFDISKVKSESIDDMFKRFHIEFKRDHPISYWIDNTIFKGKSLYSYSPHYVIFNPWILINDIQNEIKWAYQRLTRKWDSRVIWGIDYYLAEFMPIWIEELKRKQVGISSDFFEDLPWTDKGGYSDENMKIAQYRMYVVLDTISNGFRAYTEMTDIYDKDKIEELTKEFDEGFLLFHKYFHILND